MSDLEFEYETVGAAMNAVEWHPAALARFQEAAAKLRKLHDDVQMMSELMLIGGFRKRFESEELDLLIFRGFLSEYETKLARR